MADESMGTDLLKGAGTGASTGAMFGPWGAAIGGLIGAGVGAWQYGKSQKALKNLAGQPMPEYSMSPEFQQYYNTTQQRSSMGFSPEETAAFKQNVAQQQNTGFRQGVSMSGGGLSQALAAGLRSQNLSAMNQFAGQGAQLHRQNLSDWGAAAGQMQGQENVINQQKIQRRLQLEQAYGGAMQAGLGNLTQGLMSGISSTGMALDQYDWGGGQAKSAQDLGINPYGNYSLKGVGFAGPQ